MQKIMELFRVPGQNEVVNLMIKRILTWLCALGRRLIAALNFSDLHSQGSMLKLWEKPWLCQTNMLSSQLDKVGNYNGRGSHYCPVCKFCMKVTTSLQDKVKHLFLDIYFSNNRQVSVLIQHMEIRSFPPKCPKTCQKKRKEIKRKKYCY